MFKSLYFFGREWIGLVVGAENYRIRLNYSIFVFFWKNIHWNLIIRFQNLLTVALYLSCKQYSGGLHYVPLLNSFKWSSCCDQSSRYSQGKWAPLLFRVKSVSDKNTRFSCTCPSLISIPNINVSDILVFQFLIKIERTKEDCN